MNKEQALTKIEELKKYVNDIEKKKSVGIAIKKRWTGDVIFQSTKNTMKEAVKEALDNNIDLSNSNLSGSYLSNSDLRNSNLRGSNLRGSNLSGAEMQNAKFYGRGGTKPLLRRPLPDFFAALGFVIEED